MMRPLALHPFFADVDLDFERLELCCLRKRYEAGEILEDSSADVFFILSGEVRVLMRTPSGRELILAELKADQFFGELAAIGEAVRSLSICALARSEVCVMPAAVFRQSLHASPLLTDRLLWLLSSRIRELNARLLRQAVLDLKYRLYSELLRLSVPRIEAPSERIVSPPPLHHVLAARIGCRREQVTRVLSSLVSESLVSRTRGGLIIPNPVVLQERIANALREDS